MRICLDGEKLEFEGQGFRKFTKLEPSIAFSLYYGRNASTYMRPTALLANFSGHLSRLDQFHPLFFKDELIRSVRIGKHALSALQTCKLNPHRLTPYCE